MIYDICIIGAGASGLTCAMHLQDKYKVCIIDTNSKIGSKIKISGGSKCNITNKYLNSSKYLGNKLFIDKVLSHFDNTSLLSFINQHNIRPTLIPKIIDGTYFCKSSNEILNMFKSKTNKTSYYLDNKVLSTTYSNNLYNIKTNQNTIVSKKLIIASGGLSYACLGASSIGFDIAKDFGHTIINTKPALVGLTVQKEQFWFKELSGLSLNNVCISIKDQKFEGGLLFTHKGFSGPVVLNSSLYWSKGSITIDFQPNSKSYLPKRLKKELINKNIDIHNYTFSPAGNFGYTKAEATSGGIDTSEISYDMQSKIKKDLYFVGEVLDVTGQLGGYNLQWAFSSAISLCDNLLKKADQN